MLREYVDIWVYPLGACMGKKG